MAKKTITINKPPTAKAPTANLAGVIKPEPLNIPEESDLLSLSLLLSLPKKLGLERDGLSKTLSPPEPGLDWLFIPLL